MIHNDYEDQERAQAYSRLDFPGTYYLAYRDLPEIISTHVTGKLALDFGCGAGRSTRFLARQGLKAIGLDISSQMIAQAKQIDPSGDYRLAQPGDFSIIADQRFDLIQSIFTFDNIPSCANKIEIFRQLASLLNPDGRIINLVSRPEIYVYEWASFSTIDFPGNRVAKDGDTVYTIITDTTDHRPVADELCSHECYQNIYTQAGLRIIDHFCPLGHSADPVTWVNETTIAPWSIYILGKKGSGKFFEIS